MNTEILQEFLLWCLLLNLGIYTFQAIASIVLRDFMARTHGKMFGISEETAHKAIYSYLATYKILIIVFNLVPWLAIVIINQF